jgi:hypothetical protein
MEKKFLIVVIIVLIGAFGLYVFKYPPVAKETDTQAEEMVSLKSTGKDEGPSKLSRGLIEEMVQNYRNTQLLSIENAAKNSVKDDAHSILFDLDTLKKFIFDIEKGVRIIEPNANPKLAIRMYYAAYPLNAKWNEPAYKNLQSLLGDQITKLYERKHTLIMIPVIKNNKGVFADFNPYDKDTYQGFPKRAKTGLQTLRNYTDTAEIPGLNHGQLIPPKSADGEAF